MQAIQMVHSPFECQFFLHVHVDESVLTAKFIWQPEVEKGAHHAGSLVGRVDRANSSTVEPEVYQETLVCQDGTSDTYIIR